jgi:hypothetical protein
MPTELTVPCVDVPISDVEHVNELAVGVLAIINVPLSVPVPVRITGAPIVK